MSPGNPGAQHAKNHVPGQGDQHRREGEKVGDLQQGEDKCRKRRRRFVVNGPGLSDPRPLVHLRELDDYWALAEVDGSDAITGSVYDVERVPPAKGGGNRQSTGEAEKRMGLAALRTLPLTGRCCSTMSRKVASSIPCL